MHSGSDERLRCSEVGRVAPNATESRAGDTGVLRVQPSPKASAGTASRPTSRQVPSLTCVAFVVLTLAFAIPAVAAEAPKEFAELQTKSGTYKNVRVVSKNPSSITVRHSGGIAQILFKDLSTELQEAFGYVPEDMEAFEAELRAQAKAAAEKEEQARTRRIVTKVVQDAGERMDTIVRSFGAAPELKGADMRPRLRELELYVKDQGNRPSCAVYAVVSAIELQAYDINGRPEKYSEDYLVWATMQVVGERAPVALDSEGEGVIRDAGFSLEEVFRALNRFGIPMHETMKSVFGDETRTFEMPKELIAEARKRSAVIPYAVPGNNESEIAANMVHILNNGQPVIIAVRWPHPEAALGGLLSTQPPILDYAHAVTVVGYTSATGKIDDLRFIFKNSWGPRWGAYGYGFVDMQYLSKNLLGAAFIDLLPARRPAQN